MMKSLLFFLVLFAPPANAHLSFDWSIEKEFDDTYTLDVDPRASLGTKYAYESSVVIRAFKDDIAIGVGSGNYFKLGKHRFIITAAHVVEGDHTLMVLERSLDMTGVRIAYVDKALDIAILVPENNLKYTKAVPFKIDKRHHMGEKVYHCGHPAGEGWHLSEGTLTGLRPDFLMLSSFAWPGSSGSVVFDRKGRVLGVLSHILVDGPFGLPAMVEHIVMAGNIQSLDLNDLKAALRDAEE
ncbi:MAG: S1 family peptidase [Candidatus Kariarchaeaceae archaeon]|jgi:S1-C subfamily serine protease